MFKKDDPSLLPKKSEFTPIGRLVSWLLNVGRYIIIFTELIVVGAFLSRFWLDRKNTDLSEEIRQEKAILESTAPFEKEFRVFKAKLEFVEESLANPTSVLKPLEIFSKYLPQDIVILKYTFESEEKKEATILVSVFSERSLAELVRGLLREKEISAVKIGSIEREEGVSGMKVQLLVEFNFSDKKNENKI